MRVTKSGSTKDGSGRKNKNKNHSVDWLNSMEKLKQMLSYMN